MKGKKYRSYLLSGVSMTTSEFNNIETRRIWRRPDLLRRRAQRGHMPGTTNDFKY